MSRLPRDLVIFGTVESSDPRFEAPFDLPRLRAIRVLDELVAVHGGQSPCALST